MINNIFQDFERNKGNIKGKFILIFFRLTSYMCYSKNSMLRIISFPLLVFYKLFFEWMLGCELPQKTKVGNGLIIYHGQSLVINDNTIIGSNVILRNNTSVANKIDNYGVVSGSPIIGDNVEIGANVSIIGNFSIGKNSIIGAGSVVVKDIPDNFLVVGYPAKIIKKI
jgi:putative colanic acid biosynthesis acetyltransferase WcaB